MRSGGQPKPVATTRGLRSGMSLSRRARIEASGAFALWSVGVFSILRATSAFGPGTEPDSATYLAAARGLSTGHGFTGTGGDPLTFFPPLFPAAVAGLHGLGLSYLSAARFANAAAFGFLVIVTVAWVRRVTESPFAAGLAGLFVALAPPLVEMGSSALSEPFFSLFVAVSLALLTEAVLKRRGAPLAAGCAISAAFLTRYVGLVLLPVAIVGFGFSRDRRAWSRRLAVAGPPIAAAALWFARNWHVANNLTGLRPRSSIGLGTSLYQCLGAIGAWVLPAHTAGASAAAFGGILLVMVTTSAIDAAVNGRRLGNTPEAGVVPMALTAGFVLFYFLAIAVLAARTAIDPPARFLLPLFVPLVVLAAAMIVRLGIAVTHLDQRRAVVALAAAVLVVIAVSGPRLERFVTTADRDGLLTYSRPGWKNSPLLAYVRSHPPTGPVVSDDPYVLSLYAGISATLTPERTYYNSPQPTGSTGAIGHDPSSTKPTTLIWWFRSSLPHYFSLEQLGQKNCLAKQARFDDGEIYQLC